MKPRILVTGQTYIDFICRTETVPEKGLSVTSSLGYAFVAGGGGAYSAVCASRLGADIVFCTALGNDSYASQLKKRFLAEGVDTRFISINKQTQTGMCVSLTENDGSNRKIFYPGANAKLSARNIEDAFSCYPDALLVSSDIGEQNVLTATEFAKRDDVKIFLDLSDTQGSFPLEKIKNAEAVILDDGAVRSLCGMSADDVGSCLNACIKLSSLIEAKYYVINLAYRGAFLYDGTYSKVIPPVAFTGNDFTASHKAFCAAFTNKLVSGTEVSEAVAFANLVLAYCASHRGGLLSLPKLNELEAFEQNSNPEQ